MRGERTLVRGATAMDADLLVAWRADPEVARYWDGKTYTRAQMLERLSRPRVEAHVIEDAAGRPIGYLQAHDLDEDGEGGLDMFLIPEARGGGLGPDAARALARRLVDRRGWTRVTVDPYRWNQAAVRAWRRAGFVVVSEHDADEEHTAPWLLMEFRS